MFTKIKEKFKKFIFLIPLIVGLLVVFLIETNQEKLKHPTYLSFLLIVLILLSMKHLWKMSRNKEYKQEFYEFVSEEKKKKWHKRRWNLDSASTLGSLILALPIASVCFIYGFFRDGFLYGNWSSIVIIMAFVFLLISFICYKLLK